MHYLSEKTFAKRGFDADFLNKIEDGSHTPLTNIVIMCKRLHELKLSRRRIVLFPDFDMDGIASGVTGYAGCCELGFNFSLYLPTIDRGYGLHIDDVIAIKQKWPDASVIMTCDTGITCNSAIAYAKSIGMDVLVTDHHIEKYTNNGDIVVDPAGMDSTYRNVLGDNKICGAFVIWQILREYAQRYGTSLQQEAIDRLIVFVGIGTVSDIMPMVCENRLAVKDSLRILKWLMPYPETIETYGTFNEYMNTPLSGYHVLGTSPQYRAAFSGLQRLMWYFASEKHKKHRDIDEDFFGFTLAPMFNSIKRLDRDITSAFGVFFDVRQSYTYITELYELNEERKKVVEAEMKALVDIDQPFAPFVYLSDAPSGILGLLATKLISASNVPTLVVNRTALSDGKYHGSGRSPMTYNFMTALKRLQLDALGISADGHAAAFGVAIPADDAIIKSYVDILNADIADDLEELKKIDPIEQADFIIGSGDHCDVYFDVFELDEYLHDIRRYKPFGHGFFRPNIAITLTKEDMEHCPWFIIGNKSQHAKFCHEDGLDIIIWNGAGETYFCRNGFSALGHLEYTEFDNEQQLAFVVDTLLEDVIQNE